MNYIDAHVHVWTPDTTRFPLAPGFTREHMMPPSFTPEELFKHSEPSGVDRVVLIQMSYYGFANGYMLDAMQRFPTVFSGIAVIDPFAERPDREMQRLAALGVRGIRIRPGDRPIETWLDGDGYEHMWRAGAELRMAMCALIDPNALPPLSRMCARYPNTPVIIDHLCRIGADGTIRPAEVDALIGMAAYPQVQVKVSAFYALGQKQPPYDDLLPMIRRVRDAFGAERLMWASDCPFQVVSQQYDASVALIRDRAEFLTPEERAQILRGTAEAFFFPQQE